MSNQYEQQFVDARGIIAKGLDGMGLIAEGATVPTDGNPGYAPGCIFLKRAGTAGANRYKNEGSKTSCAFKAEQNLTATGVGALAVAGVAAGYKIARGVEAVTGTATVVTGLATVVAVVATMQADFSLTNGIGCSATIGDQAGTPAAGSVILKVWKPTASGDVTPIASAAACSVNWIAVGT